MQPTILKSVLFFLILSGCFSSCTRIEEDLSPNNEIATRAAEGSDETPYFYYYDGEKQYFELDTRYVFVSVQDERNAEVLAAHDLKYQPLSVDIPESWKIDVRQRRFWTTLSFDTTLSDEEYLIKLSEIRTWGKDILVAPYFKNEHQDKIGLSNFLYVKLKNEGDVALLEKEAEKEGAVISHRNEFMHLWYVVSVTENSKLNAMELANRFYESGLFEYAEPDLLVEDKLASSDPYFGQQWGLKNTGQYGGTAGIDVKVEQAWPISTGSGITVAVLDTGVDLGHPDFAGNIHSLSYDSEVGGTSTQIIKGDHGTAVAGIIGARMNNKNVNGNYEGIAGVAPNAKIMSVSNSMASTTLSREKRANGINWAWQHGADVINNSWSSTTYHQVIDDAIDDAVRYGRGNKGCVVVFASGNDNLATVSYPASLPNVIAVGAISFNGMRKSPSTPDGENWGSNYGTALDVVAPGVFIPTTDIRGNAGYNPPSPGGRVDYTDLNYTRWFNGTSAACPHVSGIAALILSQNPSLTQNQVADIIESTAQKVGGYSYATTSGRPNGTWNTQMGHGLVDAYAALQDTPPPLYNVSLSAYNSTGDWKAIRFEVYSDGQPTVYSAASVVAPGGSYSVSYALAAGEYCLTAYSETDGLYGDYECTVNNSGSVGYTLSGTYGSARWDISSGLPGNVLRLPMLTNRTESIQRLLRAPAAKRAEVLSEITSAP
ncbi:MAG: S8 family serine peptidase [Rikenellaceae bacterium]|jgi:subtilisin family serine protease|nr:S8 family serine peptidase [Rikenellaceae bacterium]